MSVRGAKLLTAVLAIICGLLLLLAFVLQIGFGRGYRWLPADEEVAPVVNGSAIDRQAFKLPPQAEFADITARPLFNEDRKPTPETVDAPVAAQPSTPLNISLTGVILTPQLHLAMIHDNAKNDPFSVREGMPLPGDLGGWTLTKVKERSALFKEASGDEVEVELTTAVASPKPGSPQPHPTGAAPAAANASAPQFGPKPPASMAKPPDTAQAEQMQRRIEERRKQMRDEAERLKQQQNPAQH
jgi:general secretion pathway protein N